jgi:tetratricopeptide (TPR) repeat protein
LLAKSLSLARRALELRVELGGRPDHLRANTLLADLHLALGRLNDAREFADRAAALGQQIGGTWKDESLLWVAACTEAHGDVLEAERLYRQITAEDGSIHETVRVALARLRPADAARILSETGAPETPAVKVITPALLGDAAATRAAIEEHGTAAGVMTCMEAYYRIGDVEKAHELLVHLREHAPEDCRESMIENVPLHREIMEAHGAR